MSNITDSVLTLVMAGGKGTRLEPLTTERAKPAVPFGGAYRIIDFTLSNCLNSGLRRILVLTQYKSSSLDRHLGLGWSFLNRSLNEFVDILPPQQRIADDWYLGTADAVYQNIFTIEQHDAEHVLILSGDHIYRMDYRDMLQAHIDSDADATIGCLPVPLHEATEFGVMGVDESNRIVEFSEKPDWPEPMPTDPDRALASMGIYIFRRDFLLERLCQDATQPDSFRDFGRNIIPSIIDHSRVQAFPFLDPDTREPGYWRDVGTLDAYFEANMDLVSPSPNLNLYSTEWPLRTCMLPDPPPKFVFNTPAQNALPARVGQAHDSLVCNGCIISGGSVERSLLSRGVRVNSYARVKNSILLPGVEIGRHAQVHNAIIDRDVIIPEGIEIGADPAADLARGFTVTESGLTVVPQLAMLGAMSAAV